MTGAEAIIARAEILYWLIERWTFKHEDWIAGWQAQDVLAAADIEVEHEDAMDLLMEMGNEGWLIKPKTTPITWRLPKALMLRRLIAHKPTSGSARRRWLDACRTILATEG